MAAFLTFYSQKNAELNRLISSGANSGYIQLYTSVLNESQNVANAGDVADATAILNDLNASNAPPSSRFASTVYPSNGCRGGCCSCFRVLVYENKR